MQSILEMDLIIKNFVKENWRKSMNEPAGCLKYKFLDPAADYRGQLWDWDSFFCGKALVCFYDDAVEYIEGCVKNFIENQASDGSIPYMIDTGEKKAFSYALPVLDRKPRSSDSELNSIKPLLAQMTMTVYKKKGDIGFLKDVYDGLKKHIQHWETTQKVQNGLFVWRSYRGSGTDNHPALYGRPLNSVAGVDLNCFMFLEYRAMSEIAKLCSDFERSNEYNEKSKSLHECINRIMWDPIDGLYYHIDVMSKKPPLAHQDISWNVPLKFRTWTCFLPMYAGIAPTEYAKRMVSDHLMNDNEFWSDYGIRTLAKNEPVYTVEETSNPSNWQGPIWIVSTYIIFIALLNYGYVDEAKKLCENLLSNLVCDIQENGAMHEYYNPETGKSSINLGFMNWNALAGIMADEFKTYEQ